MSQFAQDRLPSQNLFPVVEVNKKLDIVFFKLLDKLKCIIVYTLTQTLSLLDFFCQAGWEISSDFTNLRSCVVDVPPLGPGVLVQRVYRAGNQVFPCEFVLCFLFFSSSKNKDKFAYLSRSPRLMLTSVSLDQTCIT